METRVDLLQSLTTVEGYDRKFREGTGVRRLGADEQGEVYAAYQAYLDTIPEGKRQAERVLHGQGHRRPHGLRRSAAPACPPTTC